MNILVVPSNRPESLRAFLGAWAPWPWDRVVVVIDGPEAPDLGSGSWTRDRARLDLFTWADIEQSPQPDIFSRGDSAVRSFGFWKAWQAGADVIFTLDDDCFPLHGTSPQDFVEGHLANLFQTPAWASTVPGLRVRGLPYRNLGVLPHVAVSVGLWAGTPDLDAAHALVQPGQDDDYLATITTRVMPATQYFPMSGMNLAFRRQAACLMYFPPMGTGQPYRRFDDIWCGLALQRICRHLHLPIVCGHPVVDHRGHSDAFVNLEKEASGIRANERMWERLSTLELKAGDVLSCLREVGHYFSETADEDPYLERWGSAMLGWCDLFDLP